MENAREICCVTLLLLFLFFVNNLSIINEVFVGLLNESMNEKKEKR